MERTILHVVQSKLLQMTNRYAFLNYEAVDLLAESLENEIRVSGYAPEVAIGILSGGAYPALKISRSLGVASAYIDINHYGIKINAIVIDDLVGVYRLARLLGYKPQISMKKDIAEDVVAGKRVLIVDDDSYSGLTLEAALQSVNEKGSLEVKTALLQSFIGNPLVDFAGKLFDREFYYRHRNILPWSQLSPYYTHGIREAIDSRLTFSRTSMK